MRFDTRRVTRFGATVAIGVTAGCASSPPPYLPSPPPAAHVPFAAGETRPDPGKPAAHSADGVVRTSASEPTPPEVVTLSAAGAVRFALENNPLLQAVRIQRGVAQATVVIAQTYPFNPFLQVFEWGAGGPSSAGITNRAFNETTLRLDLEVRGQGDARRAAAGAVVTRTEWEIAAQEITVAVATTRAFNTVLYRQRKLEVLEDTVKFGEQVTDQVKKLVDLGRLQAADLIVARTELDAARAQLGVGRTALAVARADLRRQLGILNDSFEVKGELDASVPAGEVETFSKAALEQRPDVQARKAAVAEARARLRLQVADKYGNPSLGPAFEYNETRVTFVGIWLFTPIPVLNTRQGEVLMAQANLARAVADVRQAEIQTGQDVLAAFARLAEARKWADSYTGEVIPHLQQAVTDMNRLFEQNDTGVDLLRVIGVQRNYLRSFDVYLDALFELSQARADLSAAVADPALAVGMCAPSPKPKTPPRLETLPPPKAVPPPAKDKP